MNLETKVTVNLLVALIIGSAIIPVSNDYNFVAVALISGILAGVMTADYFEDI